MRQASTWLVICALLGACAQTRAPLASRNAVLAQKTAASEQAIKEALDDDFQEALKSCDERMRSIRENVVGSSRIELGLATIGIVAGAVIVPALAAQTAAAKSAIAAWGGVAGAANAGQYMLNEKGASAAAGAAVYEELRSEIRQYSLAYGNAGSNNDAKSAAVNGLAIACRFPPLPVFHAASAPQ